MASSLQWLLGNSGKAYRSALAPFSRAFSTEGSLIEINPGEIGMVSGIPQEHLLQMVMIFSPARTATQQGSGKVGRWKINFMSTQKWENPLMGWTSTGDPYANVGDAALSFDSQEAAIAFAERHGWEYTVKKHQAPLLKGHLVEHAFNSILEAGEVPPLSFFTEMVCQATIQHDYDKVVNIVNTMAHAPFQVSLQEWINLFERHGDRIDRASLNQLQDKLINHDLVKEATVSNFSRALQIICRSCDDSLGSISSTSPTIGPEAHSGNTANSDLDWNLNIREGDLVNSVISKIPTKSLTRSLFCRSLCTAATESQTQKLDRIADELLDLNKLERNDYAILFNYKMGFSRYGPAATAPASQSASSAGGSTSSAPAAAKERTTFDLKLEKFDSSVKLKVIKEIRSFTDLGLKEAKDLVEKTPSVFKKGVTKEEGEKIVEKLEEVGATVVLECNLF